MTDNKFEKFVGAQVQMEEQNNMLDVKKDDPTVTEAIKEAGNNVRVCLPGMMYTMEYVADRLNLHVEKQKDGTYKIVRVNFG